MPSPQGWYSPEYNKFVPNTVSSFKIDIHENSTLVWILQPSKKEFKPLEASIILENDQEVKIKVRSKNNTYFLDIPYFNSNGVSLKKQK